MKLKGKKALITGSSIGIGRAIAWAYAQEGADVAIHYRSSEKEAVELRDEISGTFHTKAICIKANMDNDDEIKNMLETSMRGLGGIDILVCNAGIDQKISIMDMTMEDFDKMIRVDLRSVVLCNKLVLPHMLEKGFGRIINVTSQLGQIGGVDTAHYSAAKAGVIAFTKSLAREVSKYGVNANCIAPGPVDTKMFSGNPPDWIKQKLGSLPLGRIGLPHEVAPAAVLLAADPDGNLFVGQTLGPNCGDVML
jgi:3-oxoacyl-[acyl-carrier protein] reductase